MTHINPPAEGHELVYQVRLPVSSHTFALVTEAIRTYRRLCRQTDCSPQPR